MNNQYLQRTVLLKGDMQWVTFALSLSLGLVACAPEKPFIPGTMQPALLLSSMGLFTGTLSAQQPTANGVMYDVNVPLFSDYARKRRFIFVPPGQPLGYEGLGYWQLPLGAIIVKTFSYPIDARNLALGERLIETRLLVQQTDGLHGYTFAWNAAQTDADYIADGRTVPVQWINEAGVATTGNYVIPTQVACRTCHQSYGKLSVIGLRTAQLDRLVDDGRGPMNQLLHFVERGVLPATAPIAGQHMRLAALDDPNASVELRARSYMDANCGHCHHSGGYARASSTIRLRMIDHAPTTDAQLGICLRANVGLEGRVRLVVPGAPEQSELITRLYARNPHDHMPRSTNQLVHEEAATVLRAWITGLPPQVCPP